MVVIIMKKKSSGLSQREKPTKKSKRNISVINRKAKIDYSDISELDFKHLGKPMIGRFYKPVKKQISIRLDADVLEWLKHASPKYQSLINKLCREYMEKFSKR